MKYILILIFAASCKSIDITGPKTVDKIYSRHSGRSVVKLKNLKGTFVFPTDTLKKHDVVVLKISTNFDGWRIKAKHPKNVLQNPLKEL